MDARWGEFLEEFGGGDTVSRLKLEAVPQPEGRVAMTHVGPRPGLEALSAWSPPVSAGTRFTELLSLEGQLDTVEQRLALAPLPAEDPFASARPVSRELELRVRAVRARLDLLGYRVGNVKGHHLDAPLRRAVRRFQRDAGIQPDGWVGEETWTALQDLITLEPPLELDRWYPAGGRPHKALVRALALRLRSLGFDAPGLPWMALLRKPLGEFKAVIHALGLTPLPPERLSDRDAVALVFDDEALLHLERALAVPLSLDEPEDVGPGSRFIRRLVRSELWLLGYSVGNVAHPTDTEEDRRLMKAALRAFWRDEDAALDDAALAEREGRIDVALLAALAREHHQPEATPEDVARFVEDNPEEMKDIWARSVPREPVFFIWDGLSRGARWLGRRLYDVAGKVASIPTVLARGVEHAKTFLWNVVRFVFQRASDVFTTVRKAISVFLEGIQPYLDGELRMGEGRGAVACQLRLDADSRVLVGHEAGPEASRDVALRLARMGRCLSVGARVLAAIAAVTGRVLTGPAGWATLLARLVHEAPEWEAHMRDLASLPELPPARGGEGSVWRRVALAAALVLLLSGLGLVAWARWKS